MEQITLEQAAEICAASYTYCTPGAIRGAFKKGAQWQKEQYKDLKLTFEELAHCLRNADDRPYERELIRKAIEQLQD